MFGYKCWFVLTKKGRILLVGGFVAFVGFVHFVAFVQQFAKCTTVCKAKFFVIIDNTGLFLVRLIDFN